MKKIAAIILSLFFAAFLGASITGFYPIALVNRKPIWQRTWKDAEEVVKRSLNAQDRSSAKKPDDFSSSLSMTVLLEIQRNTLLSLIEDELLKQEGDRIMDGFSAASREKVQRALSRAPGAHEGALLLYGLAKSDFETLVLFPQARRETLYEYLTLRGKDFDEWMREEKKSARVRLMFVPFEWEEGEVR